MLYYPHLNIPEEKYAWIYPLSMRLEPKADIYWWEDRQQDLNSTIQLRKGGKELQTYGESAQLERMCLALLRQYPRLHTFFFFLIDAYIMQGRMKYAGQLVEKRRQWMIRYPYKVIGEHWSELGTDKIIRTLRPYGYTYYLCMGDWIGAMRTLQFYEIDIQHKIDTGFVFVPRPLKK